MTSPVVTAQWLQENISRADLIILDASPVENKSGLIPEFSDRIIPGARYFDLENDFSRKDTDLPHMLQTPADFQEAVGKICFPRGEPLIASAAPM